MLSNTRRALFDRCLRVVQQSWPTQCVLCGATSGIERTSRTCNGCAAGLPRLPQAKCDICAVPLASGERCGPCLQRPPRYDRVFAPFAYRFPIDALIHAYKYGGDLTLAPVLAAALLTAIGAQVDAIVPMPLAEPRLRARGFNQAHEIARHLGRALGVPVLARACRRVKDTAPQAELPWGERAKNVRGAFVCDVELEKMHVAIVDDVMTTGATLDALARNLKDAGAATVCAWVVARTPAPDHAVY